MKEPKDGGHSFDVGYGKPPKHTRFKPGQSGNPRGRPRNRNDPLKLVQKILSRTVTLNDGRSVRKVTVLEATLLSVSAKAAKGDLKAAQLVLGLSDAARALDPGAEVEFGSEDIAILEEYGAQLLGESLRAETNGQSTARPPKNGEEGGE